MLPDSSRPCANLKRLGPIKQKVSFVASYEERIRDNGYEKWVDNERVGCIRSSIGEETTYIERRVTACRTSSRDSRANFGQYTDQINRY